MKKKCFGVLLNVCFLFFIANYSWAADRLALQGTTDEIYNHICEELQLRNYNSVERTLETLLTSKRMSVDGKRVLEELYEKLESFKNEVILNDWCKKNRSTHFPFVLRGNYFCRKASNLRGSGYARIVKKEEWVFIKQFLQKAQSDFETAYALEPDDPCSPAQMVNISLKRGLPEELMEKWYQRALNADSFWIRPYKAKLYYLAPWWHGSDKKMLGFQKFCYTTSPQGSSVYRIMFDIYNLMNTMNNSKYLKTVKPQLVSMYADGIRKFRRDFPQSSRPDYYEGVSNFYQYNYELALGYFNAALKIDPLDIDTLEFKVRTYMAQLELGKADEAAGELLKIDPDSVVALKNLGLIAINLRDDQDKGISFFEKALSKETDSYEQKQGCYLLASLLSNLGNHKAAIAYYTKALERDPYLDIALFKRGESKNSTGDIEGAINDMMILVEKDSKYKKGAKNRIDVFMKHLADETQKKFKKQKAIPENNALISKVDPKAEPAVLRESKTSVLSPDIGPDTIQKRFDACEAFYFRRMKNEASQCFSRLLYDVPEYADTYFMIGKIAENLESDYEKAVLYYGTAVTKESDNIKYRMSLGRVLYLTRNYQQAIEEFTKIIQKDGVNGEAYYQRGLCFDAINQKEEAIQDMQKASMYAAKTEADAYLQKNINIEPEPLKIDKEEELLRLAEQNLMYRRFDKAEKQLKDIIKMNPKNDYAYFQLGILYRDRDRDHERTLAEFDKAIRLNGNRTDYLVNRAVLLSFLKKYDLAIKDYSAALIQKPSNASLYDERARCYLKQGDFLKAEQDLKKVLTFPGRNKDHINRQLAELSAKTGSPLSVNKDNTQLLVDRGKSYRNKKEIDLAKKDFLTVIEIDPRNAAAYYELGLLYFKSLRNFPEAIRSFDKAIEIDKGKRDYFFKRGLAYFEIKDFQRAKNDFSKALKLSKNDIQILYYRGYCNKELKFKDQAIDDLLKVKKDPAWAGAANSLLQSMM